MKILLTGASSFTGYWFAKTLREEGHEILAPLRGAASQYEGVRGERVKRLASVAEIVFDASFGSERFLDVANAGGFDLCCHHAARMTGYRDPDFDIVGALAENTRNAPALLSRLAGNGLGALILTGSVFEENEGAGEEPRAAFSPYGVSKGLTAQVFAHYCRMIGLPFHKFVIPNPFGPLEEPRFCAYLARTWKARETARVNTPAYVRDNIHVSLLAKAYARFATEAAQGVAQRKINPSGYVETQGRFAQRFAEKMRARLGLPCALELAAQADFSEPLMRVNTDSAVRYVSGWDEERAWDEAAAFYR